MPCYCDNHLKNKIAGNHFNMLHLTSHPSTQRVTLLIAGQCRCTYLYRYSYLYSYNSWCERPFMHNQQRSQITHLLYTVSSVKLWNVHRGCPQVRTVPLTLESALSVGGMKAHTPYRKIRKLAEFGRNDTGGTREFREVKWGLQERQMTSFFFFKCMTPSSTERHSSHSHTKAKDDNKMKGGCSQHRKECHHSEQKKSIL